MHTQAQLLKPLCWQLLREQNAAVLPVSSASTGAAAIGHQLSAQGRTMAADGISARHQVLHTLQFPEFAKHICIDI
jgi:hypothetical protein